MVLRPGSLLPSILQAFIHHGVSACDPGCDKLGQEEKYRAECEGRYQEGGGHGDAESGGHGDAEGGGHGDAEGGGHSDAEEVEVMVMRRVEVMVMRRRWRSWSWFKHSWLARRIHTSNYLTYTSQFDIFKLCQTFRPHSVVIISGKYRIGNIVAIYN